MTYPISQLVLSHSSLSTFERCARKFEFAKMYGEWDGAREEIFAGAVGNALHRGFQEYLISRDNDKAMFALLKAYPYEQEFLRPENSSRSLEACYATLATMMASPIAGQYALTQMQTQQKELKNAIEVPFAIKIVNSPMPIPVYFVGLVDAFLFDIVEFGHFPCDIKTTRMWADDYSARYEFDDQCVPYGIVLEHILGKTIEQFSVAYLLAYVDILDPKIALYRFTKTKAHINDWFLGLCDKIARIAKYTDTEWFPRITNGEACFSFRRKCPRIEFCSYRGTDLISRLLDATPNDKLFHDGQVPWITAELEYVRM